MVTRFVIDFDRTARNFARLCVSVFIIAFDLKFTSVGWRHKNKTVIPMILGEHWTNRLRADELGLTLYSLCVGLNNKEQA